MTTQLVVLPDDGFAALLAPLAAAQQTIDMYVFTVNNPALLAAVAAAVGRGVRVRAIVEPQPGGHAAVGQAGFAALQQAGVAVQWAPTYYPRLHAKSYVVDGSTAVISSGNFLADWQHTRDYALIAADPALAAGLSAAFAADWTGRPDAAPPAPPLVLSPANSRTVVADLIAGATRTLWLEQEQISDPALLAALAARGQAGVVIHILTNGAQSKNAPALAALVQAAPTVAVRYSTALVMHAKLIIADETQMLLGSVNLIAESLDQRREVSVVLTDPAYLARVSAVVAADFAAGATEPPSHPQPAGV